MALIYIGPRDANGVAPAFLEGVPARDLDDDYLKTLHADDINRINTSGLYRPEVRIDAETLDQVVGSAPVQLDVTEHLEPQPTDAGYGEH